MHLLYFNVLKYCSTVLILYINMSISCSFIFSLLYSSEVNILSINEDFIYKIYDELIKYDALLKIKLYNNK